MSSFPVRFLSFVLLVTAPGWLSAQPETATLRGTVTDTAGAPLEDATLLIADESLKVPVRQVDVAAVGNYEISGLWPGSYRLTVRAPGYQSLVAEGIFLESGQVARFDPKLTKGQPADTETVAEAGSLSVKVGESLDYKSRWNDAPFADRHPSAFHLLTTAPAVQAGKDGLVLSGLSSRDRQGWSIDGVPDDLTGQLGNPSFYETVEVTLANAAVDAARPVSVTMMSKRGSAGLHGLLYYRRAPSLFQTRSYFDADKVPYKLSEAAGELGWPLVRNWTYLYGGGMYQKLSYRQSLYADIPTVRMRSNDLGEFLNPLTAPNGKTVQVRDPRTGLPLANNLIPSNRVSTVSSKYVHNYYPRPNTGDPNSVIQNYVRIHRFGPDSYNGNWPFVRLDQKLSDNNLMYVRWFQNQTASVAPGSVDRSLDSTYSPRYRSFVVSDAQVFSPGVVNRFSAARIRSRIKQGQSEADVDPPRGDSIVTTLGIQGVNPEGYSAVGFPAVSIRGLTGLSMVYGGGLKDNIAHDDGFVSVEDSVSWYRGRHTVKAGVQFSRYSWRQGEVPQTVYGAFTFSGAFTGLAYADFLLGLPATSVRRTVMPDRRIRQNQAGLFLADSFRVGPRLLLDYGVRWDYYGTPVYRDGYMANWDPASGRVTVAPGTYTAVSAYYPKAIPVVAGKVVPEAKTTNLRPRLGAAFRLSNRLLLRGGYGEFTETYGFGPAGRLNPMNPYALTETYTNSITGAAAALSFPRPFPASPSSSLLPSQTVTAYPMKTDEGVIRHFSFSLETEAYGTGWRAAYIGSRGSGMNYLLDINKPRAGAEPFSTLRKPFPALAEAYVVRNDGLWHYDSLLAQAYRRTGPLSFDASLTWANNISNYANTYDPYDVTSHWSRDAANRRLYSVGSLAWSLPVGKGRRLLPGAGPLLNGLAGDWSLLAAATLASGQYFSPLFTGPDPANASEGYVTQLPDCVGNPKAGARSRDRWFDPAAFAPPPASAGRYGTCGMNTLEGYPIHVAHLGLVKRVPMGELLRAVFTVRVSNVTNTPHFTIPNHNISDPNPGMFPASSLLGGSSPAALGPRQVDFKLRLEW